MSKATPENMDFEQVEGTSQQGQTRKRFCHPFVKGRGATRPDVAAQKRKEFDNSCHRQEESVKARGRQPGVTGQTGLSGGVEGWRGGGVEGTAPRQPTAGGVRHIPTATPCIRSKDVATEKPRCLGPNVPSWAPGGIPMTQTHSEYPPCGTRVTQNPALLASSSWGPGPSYAVESSPTAQAIQTAPFICLVRNPRDREGRDLPSSHCGDPADALELEVGGEMSYYFFKKKNF